MVYTGDEKPWCPTVPAPPDTYCYSGHDGYDYSYGVTAGTVISAAHLGTVTIPQPFNNCIQYQVYVTSDDGLYQTRYLHLASDITNQPYVNAGDRIGRVGNVRTPCIKGPHLHFGAYYDRNGDGQFETDEKVDPYGWQPTTQIDPWTTTFQDRFGRWHTGTASTWLWNFSPPAQRQLSPDAPASLTTSDGIMLQVPAGAVNSPATLAYTVAPEPTGSPDGPSRGIDGRPAITLRAGHTFQLTAAYSPDYSINSLNTAAQLTIPYTAEDIAAVAEATLTIYRWDTQAEQWLSLPTTLDPTNRIAQAPVEQLGIFSLRGRPLAPRPGIVALSPTQANNRQVTTLVIYGGNFTSAPIINLGMNTLEVISVTPTTVTAIVPAGIAPGVYSLRLQNPDGQTIFVSNAYTVLYE